MKLLTIFKILKTLLFISYFCSTNIFAGQVECIRANQKDKSKSAIYISGFVCTQNKDKQTKSDLVSLVYDVQQKNQEMYAQYLLKQISKTCTQLTLGLQDHVYQCQQVKTQNIVKNTDQYSSLDFNIIKQSSTSSINLFKLEIIKSWQQIESEIIEKVLDYSIDSIFNKKAVESFQTLLIDKNIDIYVDFETSNYQAKDSSINFELYLIKSLSKKLAAYSFKDYKKAKSQNIDRQSFTSKNQVNNNKSIVLKIKSDLRSITAVEDYAYRKPFTISMTLFKDDIKLKSFTPYNFIEFKKIFLIGLLFIFIIALILPEMLPNMHSIVLITKRGCEISALFRFLIVMVSIVFFIAFCMGIMSVWLVYVSMVIAVLFAMQVLIIPFSIK